MGTVIGAWTPFYGIGAIMSHWVTGLLRDSTGHYQLAFLTNAVMALVGVVLILFVKKRSS
jgi:MFS-type transporter involved in bile tolerance (Atg22 family)